MGETYAAAGVSIDAGDDAVRRIKPHVATTVRPEVIGGIGGFGGLFALDVAKYRHPVLVSTTDGVGTKIEVARELGRLDTVGVDLVAMCVDDLICVGAEPLFFLDYMAVGALDPLSAEQVVAGIAAGCRSAGCALVGGEMAEHPGIMAADQFDLAGFAVGVVERDEMLDGSRVRAGDVLIGLESPGLRSNGYSLARRLMFDVAGRSLADPCWDEAGAPTVGDELLRPSVIYAAAVQHLLRAGWVHALAHITGGGIPGNLPRVLGDGFDGVVVAGSWPIPRIFSELQRIGSVDDAEMRRTFNMGIGMIAAVAESDATSVIDSLAASGVGAHRIGVVDAGAGSVRYA